MYRIAEYKNRQANTVTVWTQDDSRAYHIEVVSSSARVSDPRPTDRALAQQLSVAKREAERDMGITLSGPVSSGGYHGLTSKSLTKVYIKS